MAAWKTSHRLCALAPLIALAACDSGEISQSVFSVEAFCTLSPRLAVVVEIYPGDSAIDSVTASSGVEQHCYLERAASDSAAEDAGEAEAALYSCLFQGHGTYEVRVKSGKKTWSQSVEVAGDDCHVAELQKLTFEL